MTQTVGAPEINRRSDFDDLRHAVHRRTAPILRNAGLDDHEISVTIEGSVSRLRIVVAGPSRAASLRQALSVRILDAVHADGRTYGRVEVDYELGEDDES